MLQLIFWKFREINSPCCNFTNFFCANLLIFSFFLYSQDSDDPIDLEDIDPIKSKNKKPNRGRKPKAIIPQPVASTVTSESEDEQLIEKPSPPIKKHRSSNSSSRSSSRKQPSRSASKSELEKNLQKTREIELQQHQVIVCLHIFCY